MGPLWPCPDFVQIFSGFGGPAAVQRHHPAFERSTGRTARFPVPDVEVRRPRIVLNRDTRGLDKLEDQPERLWVDRLEIGPERALCRRAEGHGPMPAQIPALPRSGIRGQSRRHQPEHRGAIVPSLCQLHHVPQRLGDGWGPVGRERIACGSRVDGPPAMKCFDCQPEWIRHPRRQGLMVVGIAESVPSLGPVGIPPMLPAIDRLVRARSGMGRSRCSSARSAGSSLWRPARASRWPVRHLSSAGPDRHMYQLQGCQGEGGVQDSRLLEPASRQVHTSLSERGPAGQVRPEGRQRPSGNTREPDGVASRAAREQSERQAIE